MIFRFALLLSLFCFSVIITGCSVLFSEQEWSENYALLNGASSTSSQMIDGDINTVGEASASNVSTLQLRSNSSPEVIITLPGKKIIRRIVIHSDNIKKFNLYADKGGSAISDSDWKLIKEAKSVKSGPIVIPILYSFPTDRVRLVVLGTTDDAALTRKEGARRVLPIQSTQSGGS